MVLRLALKLTNSKKKKKRFRPMSGCTVGAGWYGSILFAVVLNFRTVGSLVRSSARSVFFARIDDSHCDKMHSFHHSFDNGYVGKQTLAQTEYCAEHW